MTDIRQRVMSMLENYLTMKQELKVLEFELEHAINPLHSTEIEDMVFSHPGGERVTGSFLSDKTANIAVEHVGRQQDAKYHALRNLISNIRLEMHRLEHYLSLLTRDEADVIRWSYFEQLSWADIAEKTGLTTRTMQRRREQGLKHLVNCYSVMDKLTDRTDDVRMKARFISYVHEEQYERCLQRIGKEHYSPGLEAMMYIISGCNELWNAGLESFIDLDNGKVIPQESMTTSLSIAGAALLRLAYCFVDGLKLGEGRLIHVLHRYFSDLEYIHLELAMEAMRLALFSEI